MYHQCQGTKLRHPQMNYFLFSICVHVMCSDYICPATGRLQHFIDCLQYTDEMYSYFFLHRGHIQHKYAATVVGFCPYHALTGCYLCASLLIHLYCSALSLFLLPVLCLSRSVFCLFCLTLSSKQLVFAFQPLVHVIVVSDSCGRVRYCKRTCRSQVCVPSCIWVRQILLRTSPVVLNCHLVRFVICRNMFLVL